MATSSSLISKICPASGASSWYLSNTVIKPKEITFVNVGLDLSSYDPIMD